MDRIAVIGAGIMGHGIAQVLAQAKCQVAIHDVDEAGLQRARDGIARSLGRLAKKNALPEPAELVMERIRFTKSMQDAVAKAEFVIEAVPERLELKTAVFAELDELAPKDAVLATNTSQLSVTRIAAATTRPERVIGMHWFNPVPVMKLVEIAKAIQTSPETLKATVELSHRAGKETVVVKDSQGFVTTRLLGALLTEALRIHEEGVASMSDVDKAIKLGLNHPMGPFELLDLTGVETNLFAQEALWKVYGDRFLPSQAVRKLVEAGRFGRKTGQGFYRYGENGERLPE